MANDPPLLLHKVKKIAVLRPNAVGDFVFSLPALHALKAAYPEAEIVYIGKRWHAGFLDGRPGPVDKVEVIPPYPGVGAPLDTQADAQEVQSFIDRMRGARFDFAVQLYGGGLYSNPFVRRLGARVAIGMKAPGAPPLDRWVHYEQLQNRRLQMLEAVALAGADTLRIGPELRVTQRDRSEAGRIVPADAAQPLVVIQPAASDGRRCWSAERFAAVADALAREGALIAVNGTETEAPIVRRVIETMRYPAADLSGRLSLCGLCGLLERAALLVSNDTGPLHLALAIGTPCVGIYWLTNMIESGPLRQGRHRAALSVRLHCPVCGEENLRTRCVHDVGFVDDVAVEEVTGFAMELLRERKQHGR